MNILKCNTCNIIVDELLTYIQSKVSIMDEDSLVRICASHFNSEEIKKSKTLLFNCISTDVRKISRKNRGKEERDISDIINLFKSTEPDIIPVFVARQLDKLPPIQIDHLDCSKLLRDLMTMKAELEGIKATYVTQDSVSELRREILRIQNDSLPPPASAFKVNKKRGAWLDSGPMGLCHDYNNISNNDVSPSITSPSYRDMRVALDNSTAETNIERSPEAPAPRGAEAEADTGSGETCAGVDCGGGSERTTLPPRTAAAAATACVCVGISTTEPLRREASAETGSLRTEAMTSDVPVMTDQLTDKTQASYSSVIGRTALEQSSSKSVTMSNDSTNNEGWQTGGHRKKQSKYRFMGKSGVARDLESTFRAADRKLLMFITNLHMSATENDIVKHIFKKTNETVILERINMKHERGHKAFKFMISEVNLPKYMDATLWPAGVLFRRFVNFRHKYVNGVTDTDGTHKNNNG